MFESLDVIEFGYNTVQFQFLRVKGVLLLLLDADTLHSLA
jgi:hypothetical protein